MANIEIATMKAIAGAERPRRWVAVVLLALVVFRTTSARVPAESAPSAWERPAVTPSRTPERLGEVARVNLKAALVTFGGAYTVLPYLREQAVTVHKWVPDEAVVDALSLAETTPGPLVSVGVFLAYLAAGPWGALVGGVCLFAPSFVLVLGLGNRADRLLSAPRARQALAGLGAATLGLIVGLASSLAPTMIRSVFGLTLAVAATALVTRWKWSPALVVGLGAILGLARSLVP